jgi:hypothetical protein
VPLGRDAALVEAGADLQITTQVKVGVFYAGYSPPVSTITQSRAISPGDSEQDRECSSGS